MMNREEAVKHNLKILMEIDIDWLVNDITSTFNMERAGNVILEGGVFEGLPPWYWEKIGLVLQYDGLSEDTLLSHQAPALELITRTELGWNVSADIRAKLKEKQEQSDRDFTNTLIDGLTKYAQSQGWARVTIQDLQSYKYELSNEKGTTQEIDSSLPQSTIVSLVNGKLGTPRTNKRIGLNKQLKEEVLRRDGYKCQSCRAKQTASMTLHVDHIVPISKGGTDELSNLQALCPKCNAKKGRL